MDLTKFQQAIETQENIEKLRGKNKEKNETGGTKI
jgi:hypothetical protein